MKKLRALYFGTPQLSADILSNLIDHDERVEIVGVVTSPDKVGGRGHEIISSSVAKIAQEKGIPVFQPEKVKNEEFLEAVRALKPDICLVVAYGKILPQVLIDIPPMGFLNVHTSLLPKYRGAAPIQHALLHGDKVTGLTVQQMALAMDEGDILVQEKWDISESDTTGILFAKTGERGGPILIEAMQGLIDGSITPTPQNQSEATYTKMIEKQDGELNPSLSTSEAYHAWQAYTPWPGLFYHYGETRVTLLEVEKSKQSKYTPGEWIIHDKNPAIVLADGMLIIKKIHPAGKKPMSGEEFARGFMKA